MDLPMGAVDVILRILGALVGAVNTTKPRAGLHHPPAFSDPTAADFRLPAGHPALKLNCYPCGERPSSPLRRHRLASRTSCLLNLWVAGG